MLDTLLEIGKILRASGDLKHHRYLKPAPTEVNKQPVRFFPVPVEPNGSFDFSRKEDLKDENRIAQCFYLNYKAGEADSSKNYVFGDIFRSYIVKGKAVSEAGNYKLGDPGKKSWSALSSFTRFEKPEKEGDKRPKAENAAKAFLTERIKMFRRSFKDQQADIEKFISETPLVYLHFDFGGKAWYELEDWSAIQALILSNFVQESEHGYVLKSFLFKTIGVGGGSSTPDFTGDNAHKVRRFESPAAIEDLIYALNSAGRAAVRERDIKIIVLPRGDKRNPLTAPQIERFFARTGSADATEEAIETEEELKRETAPTADVDPLFAIVPERAESDPNLLQFDFIFSLAGGTKPDVDLIELAGLDRSRLTEISHRVRHLRHDIQQERAQALASFIKKPLEPPLITRSFLNILGDATKAKKKYQSHLLKVLPQIYTESYYHDPVLLPALIEKTENNIRNDVSPTFSFLKWDFYFLTRLQNSQGDSLMAIQDSPSYRVGVLLGTMSQPLSWKINSFSKNYAGLLTRRIGTIGDVAALAADINQKLIMHDCVGFTRKASHELSQMLAAYSGPFNKHECALGFFEAYYAPRPEKELPPEDETLEEPAQGAFDLQSS